MRQATTALSRRRLLRVLLLAAPAPLLLAACGGQAPAATAPGPSRSAPPTAAPSPTTPPVTPTTAPPTATTAPASATTAPPPATAAAAPVTGQVLAPTPECGDADDVTPAQTEGPYYKRDTPERASLLEPGMAGTKLIVTGRVLSTRCQPVARALLDFWQADDKGQYDTVGQRLRGHQFTDPQGVYRLETIVPALYTGRTRHIHVKVQAPSRPVLTTQLYFPNEPRNASDGIFRRELVMAIRDVPGGREASFDFVLNVG